MLKWLLNRWITRFEKAFDYDMSYARELLAADPRAFLRFARVTGLSSYRRDVPVEASCAAKLVATMREDCGPCTQLGVTMALKEGVREGILEAILRGDQERMGPDAALAAEFARAVLDHDPAADELRAQVLHRWGPRGLVSLSFGILTGRLFPTLKYAMGHGIACQRVIIGGKPVAVPRLAA